jgi:hypothetical protein
LRTSVEPCAVAGRVGAPDGHLGKFDLAAGEALWRLGDDIAGLDRDLGAEPFERHQQEVDGSRPDGAAARQGHARLAHAREQRRDHPEARSHARDEFIGRGRVDDGLGAQVRGLASHRLFTEALAVDGEVDAMVAEDPGELTDVREARQILQRQHLIGEQRGDHQRKRRILGAGNWNYALELRPTPDLYAIHSSVLSLDGAITRQGPRLRSSPSAARPARLASRRARAAALCGASGSRATPPRDARAAAALRLPVPRPGSCPPRYAGLLAARIGDSP